MKIDRKSFRSQVTLVSLNAIVMVLLFAGGCRSYPEVTTAESQTFIKQVYTACNTQSIERIDKCSERLRELTRDQKVTEVEAAAFERIISLARSNDWSAAQDQALTFARRQVR